MAYHEDSIFSQKQLTEVVMLHMLERFSYETF
jgi:hypothetical protein